MTSDDAVQNITGRFGRYQVWILFLITIGRTPTDYQQINVVFILPDVDFVCMDEESYNITNHCPCRNPVYDQSTIHSSVTSTWDLICDRSQLASLAQSILHVGILIGSLFYGHISDRYGRKIATLVSLSTEVIFVSLSATVTELWMFIVLRLLIGTAVGGTMLCSYILIIELSGKSFRPYLNALTEMSFILANITLPGIAYLIRDWRYLQLATSVPWTFVGGYYFLIPESSRWLITTGKKAEAIKVLTNIAKKNSRPTDNIPAIVEKVYQETTISKQQFGSYLDLFKTTKIRNYTVIAAFVWLCCAHTFFGVIQYIGRLQGDIYLNVLLSAATLPPSLILLVIISSYLSRKTTTIGCFILAGVSLIMYTVIPNYLNSLKLSMALLGNVGSYLAFTLVYLYTSEIFPTLVRNSAMGFASVFARFGGFIAPFVVNIGIEWVSIIIFSILAFCAAFLCFFLPETKGIVLPNTIREAEGSSKTAGATVEE